MANPLIVLAKWIGKAMTKEGAKTVVKEGAKETLKAGIKETAKAVVKGGVKEVAKKTGESVAKEGVKAVSGDMKKTMMDKVMDIGKSVLKDAVISEDKDVAEVADIAKNLSDVKDIFNDKGKELEESIDMSGETDDSDKEKSEASVETTAGIPAEKATEAPVGDATSEEILADKVTDKEVVDAEKKPYVNQNVLQQIGHAFIEKESPDRIGTWGQSGRAIGTLLKNKIGAGGSGSSTQGVREDIADQQDTLSQYVSPANQEGLGFQTAMASKTPLKTYAAESDTPAETYNKLGKFADSKVKIAAGGKDLQDRFQGREQSAIDSILNRSQIPQRSQSRENTPQENAAIAVQARQEQVSRNLGADGKAITLDEALQSKNLDANNQQAMQQQGQPRQGSDPRLTGFKTNAAGAVTGSNYEMPDAIAAENEEAIIKSVNMQQRKSGAKLGEAAAIATAKIGARNKSWRDMVLHNIKKYGWEPGPASLLPTWVVGNTKMNPFYESMKGMDPEYGAAVMKTAVSGARSIRGIKIFQKGAPNDWSTVESGVNNSSASAKMSLLTYIAADKDKPDMVKRYGKFEDNPVEWQKKVMIKANEYEEQFREDFYFDFYTADPRLVPEKYRERIQKKLEKGKEMSLEELLELKKQRAGGK